jgi:hypothetical protein
MQPVKTFKIAMNTGTATTVAPGVTYTGATTIGPTSQFKHTETTSSPADVDDADSIAAYTDDNFFTARSVGHDMIRIVNPAYISQKSSAWSDFSSDGYMSDGFVDKPKEPRFLYTTFYPTPVKNGKIIRNAVTNGIFTTQHRVGSKNEHQLFKVKVMTSRQSKVLFYESPTAFERCFFHDKVRLPESAHNKWGTKSVFST